MQESGENYLETILILKDRNGTVRSVDIANELGYTKPSVCRAVKLLVERGFIFMQPGGELILTDLGIEKANAIYERQKTLSYLLHEIIGVSKGTADHDACRIEHVISDESFDKIREFIAEKA